MRKCFRIYRVAQDRVLFYFGMSGESIDSSQNEAKSVVDRSLQVAFQIVQLQIKFK